MSELSDEASGEPLGASGEPLGASLSLWLGGPLARAEGLDVPLDLHTACSIGLYDVVAECIKKREVNLDRKNLGGWTPLMYTSYIGHDHLAALLLEAGVAVNATSPRGLSALMLAASCGNESIAYFLLQHGAELEMKDLRGWTALLHCTSAGHQQMARFLLDNHANANAREPRSGFTPLMEAAASGHEIIVQHLLDHKAAVEQRSAEGQTASALALKYGYTKIAGLIAAHCPRTTPGPPEDPSSSEDSDGGPPLPSQRPRPHRTKGPSIHDGPQAIAKFHVGAPSKPSEPVLVPPGYMTFRDPGEQSEGICCRDVISPINELDGQSNSSRGDESPLLDGEAPARRSSSSSCEGARPAARPPWGGVESDQDSDRGRRTSWRVPKGHHAKSKSRHGNSEGSPSGVAGDGGARAPGGAPATYTGPKDLAAFLEQMGFSKYLGLLEEQDIDLRIFLTLTENDLKEVGITLFGPKRKMTHAIARWHSNARPPGDALEEAYADQLEAEMQEMAIQLHKRCEEAEALQGQVSQEKGLRAVVEGCLAEDKAAWRRVHGELVESHRLAQEMNATLEGARAARAQLGGRLAAAEGPPAAGPPAPGGPGSVTELMKRLEAYDEELAGTLHTVLQSLRRLSVSDQVTDSWERP